MVIQRSVPTQQTGRHQQSCSPYPDTCAGQAQFASGIRDSEAACPNVPIIGYFDDDHILLLPEVAYREVNRVQALKFSTSAIGAQLSDGKLLPGATTLTVQRRVHGMVTRMWQLKLDFLTGDDGAEPQRCNLFCRDQLS